jgi:hypothetical protein
VASSRISGGVRQRRKIGSSLWVHDSQNYEYCLRNRPADLLARIFGLYTYIIDMVGMLEIIEMIRAYPNSMLFPLEAPQEASGDARYAAAQ